MVESLDITSATFHIISPHLFTITCYKSITYGLLLSLTVVPFVLIVLCSFIIGDGVLTVQYHPLFTNLTL